MNNCQKCGKEIDAGADVCGFCGAPAENAGATAVQPVTGAGLFPDGIAFSVNAIIDSGFRLWIKALGPLIILQLIMFSVMAALVILMIIFAAAFFGPDFGLPAVKSIVAAAVPAVIAAVAVSLAATAGSYMLIEDYAEHGDKKREIKDSLMDGFRKLPVMLCAVMAYVACVIICAAPGLAVMAGMREMLAAGALLLLTGMAGMLYLFIRMYPLFPVIVLENRGAVESMKRSWELTGGRWWKVLGIVLAITLIFFGIGIGIGIVGFIPVLGQIAYIGMQIILGPLNTVFSYCCYDALKKSASRPVPPAQDACHADGPS
ncbi:MAG: glycerophosphoryl diester phosphodiesterase membrane domain-containing protein [Spirochaetes bacterium]|jgi:hypothetical protein|nr:glycerophosphoryl diester phosphodiesterase membrane domain-containing protein [Spirochaetota bacterium]